MLEDCEADAGLMEFELQEAGIPFMSKRVITEDDFVQALREFSPDIILSDYDLPQYNGLRALAEAKARCSEIPFILVTGVSNEDLAKEIITKGADDFVMKSQLHELARGVRRAAKIATP